MLRIRHKVKFTHIKTRQRVEKEVATRGPFLTDDTEFDAGVRTIVITLHPTHMVLRHARSGKGLPLTYAKAIAVARRERDKERQALKKHSKGGVKRRRR